MVQETSARGSPPLFDPLVETAPTVSPGKGWPSRQQRESINSSKKGQAGQELADRNTRRSKRHQESSSDVAEESESESDGVIENEDVEDENAEDEDVEEETAEARAHAMVREEYTGVDGEADTSQDSENEAKAHHNDRNDSALDLDDESDALLMPRLFNQFIHLREIVEAVIKLQAHVDEMLGDQRPKEPLFQEFDTLRRKLRTSYKALIDPASEENASEDRRIITRSVTKLQRLVKALDPDAAATNRRTLLKNIYAFVFPDLVKILAGATYNLIKGTESDDDIVSPDLSELIRLTRCIVELGDRTSKWETKVDPDLKLVKPVRNKIVAPLKQVLKVFERQHAWLEREEQRAEMSLRRTQELRRERTEKEFEKRRTQESSMKETRLRDLYIWRMSVEGELDRRIGKLAQPNLRRQKIYPLDANGEPFEREAIFKPRSSIPHMDRPGAAEEDEDWTDAELEALQQGLADFARKSASYNSYISQAALTKFD
jgi:hypothetical protein